MPWYVPLLAATITATATLPVYLANKYFTCKAHLPTVAEALMSSLHIAIAHTKRISQGTNVYGRHSVTSEEFYAFRSNLLWPWPIRRAQKHWEIYRKSHDPSEQLIALHNLLKEVKRRYAA